MTDHEQRQAELEADLTVTWATVQAARQAWAHSPNSHTVDRAAEAEAELNALLEQYSALQLEATADALVTP